MYTGNAHNRTSVSSDTVCMVYKLYYCSSLENCPTKNTLADDPEGLTVTLMTHQKRGLAWMVWRETQTPAAGILGVCVCGGGGGGCVRVGGWYGCL